MFLHVFAHIDANHRLFRVEQKAGERLAQFCLTDAVGPGNMKLAIGLFGSERPGERWMATHRLHRLVLTHDNACEARREIEVSRARLVEAWRRECRPFRYDVGDVRLGEMHEQRGPDDAAVREFPPPPQLTLGFISVPYLSSAALFKSYSARRVECYSSPVDFFLKRLNAFNLFCSLAIR